METDSKIQGNGVGLWFPSHNRGQIRHSSFWQVTRNQKREWRDLPWAQWQYRDGLRSTGRLSTGQRWQFKISLTHLLIILILSCPEARGAYQGCPNDTPSWSPPTCCSPMSPCSAQTLHPEQLQSTTLGHLRSNTSHFIGKKLVPQAKLGSYRGRSDRHYTNIQVAKRSLSPKKIWGQCLQLECWWLAY